MARIIPCEIPPTKSENSEISRQTDLIFSWILVSCECQSVGPAALSCRSKKQWFDAVVVVERAVMTNLIVQISRKTLNTNRFNVVAIVLSLAYLGMLSVTLLNAAQNPARSSVASGGTVAAQSATHKVSGTIGQIATGRPQSATNSVAEGFWNTLGICECPHIGDIDTNSTIDILDVVALVNSAFRGAPIPPGDRFCPLTTRGDLNCDNLVDILDVVAVVNTAFRNLDSRCNPCIP